MAKIVLGAGTSHSPMLSVPPHLWDEYAQVDRTIDELIFPPRGDVWSYDEALDHVEQDVRDKPRDLATYEALAARCQTALDTIAERLRAAAPDVIVIVSNDQDEWFFEDNLPRLAVYWGNDVRIVPRTLPGDRPSEILEAIKDGFGAVEQDVPVSPELGKHLIESLMDAGFDPSAVTYRPRQAGGRITRRYDAANRRVEDTRTTPEREQGLPHGFSFIVVRLLAEMGVPIVPVFLNTCYPPNHVNAERGLEIGEAIGNAIRSWESDARVAVVASGGLSHLVVDEVADRELLDALEAADFDSLSSTPAYRHFSAGSEAVNWIAVSAAVDKDKLSMDVVDYVPCYRTEVGTGGGWAFATWQEPNEDVSSAEAGRNG